MKPPEVLASVDAEVCPDAAPLEKKNCGFSRSKNMVYVGVLDLMGRIEEVARRKRSETLGARKGWKGNQSSFASLRNEGAVQSRKCKHS